VTDPQNRAAREFSRTGPEPPPDVVKVLDGDFPGLWSVLQRRSPDFWCWVPEGYEGDPARLECRLEGDWRTMASHARSPVLRETS
jgi:hypothetical protein